MRGKLLLSVGMLFISAIGGAAVYQQNAQALDSSRDCDKYAVVYCGTMSTSEIRDKYNQKDHAKVFSAFGISKADISGDIRSGVVYRDGRVVVGGKTVATNATMAARNLGGSGISGSSAKKVSVSKMSDSQTAFVKFDSNGRFMWAIMKPCGNPVSGTPTKPKPKAAAACKALTATSLSRADYRLDASATTANGASVSKYSFVVKDADGKTVASESISTKALKTSLTIRNLQPGTYDATLTVTTSVGNKTSSDCVVTFTVAPPEEKTIEVCDLETKQPVAIDEKDFDSSKHSRDFDDCKQVPVKIKVCEIATKKIVTINEKDFDSIMYSKNLDDCKEVPETPPVLPETGAADIIAQFIGALSLTGASAYYLTSRR